ncbi:MAG: VWA domain-containing protein [Ruminococcus sp.]|nr:VWA domain-containing protein [Ruminococcus sp.]
MSNQKSVTRSGSRKAPKLLSLIMVIVLLGTLAVDGYCAYDLLGRKIEPANSQAAEEQRSEDKTEKKAASAERTAFEQASAEVKKSGNKPLLYSLLDGMENKTVNSDNEGLEFIKAVHAELGVKNADEDLVFDTVVADDNWVHRHYKQVHKGIEVLGGGVTVTTDKETGKVVDVSGRQFDIPDDIKTEPTVSFDDAKKSAQKYVSDVMKKDISTIRLDNEGVKLVPVYVDKVLTGYKVCVSNKNNGRKIADVIVDSETGQAAAVKSYTGKTLRTDTGSKNNSGRSDATLNKSVDNIGGYKVSDEQYDLSDNDKNIKVLKPAEAKVDILETEGSEVYSFDPTEITPEEQAAIDTLGNAEGAYDLFNTQFGRRGIDGNGSGIAIVYGGETIGFDTVNGEETADISGCTTYAGENTIYVGKTADGASQAGQAAADEIGSAYAQGVIESESELFNGFAPVGSDPERSEAVAIGVGLSEVFGEIVEDYVKDGQLNNNCDWVNGSGELKSASADVNTYKEYETSCTDGKLIVTTFAAELAASGVDMATVANLLYDVIPMLTAKTTFVKFRMTVEAVAAEYAVSSKDGRKLTEEQFEKVIDAFDKVGIPVNYDYTLVSEGTIRVNDENDEAYDSFKVKLASYNDPEKVIFEGECTADSFKLPASVPNGLYILTLTDKNDEMMTASYTIIINNNSPDSKTKAYDDSITAYTQFGAEARDVVLVLDISGSMDGNPIEQTREAAGKFVDTVLTQSPSTRISIVTYSSEASDLIISSNQKAVLTADINSLYSGGGTNIHEGLTHADDILNKSKSQKKLIVLMSDGYPNRGPDESGDFCAPIVKLADQIKDKGVTIYTLGFFHNLSGSELSECQKLMSDIASEGYDYTVDNADDVKFDVADPESDLYKVFNDFAEMINGKKYINIRIACPVDVTVSYNGETLSSDKKHPITRTSFGSLSYEKIIDDETGKESEDTVKVLRLEEGTDYEVCINGTGKGKMNYTISYPDEDGEYNDVRSFKNVPITKETVIATSTKQEEEVKLNVDTDGDGTFDLNYGAEKNKKAEEISEGNMMTVIFIIVNSLLGVVIVLYAVFAIKKKIASKKAARLAQPIMPTACTACGAPLDGSSKFCRSCGAAVQMIMPEPAAVQAPEIEPAKKRSKAPAIIKLSVIGVCAAVMIVTLVFYNSPATTVFKQIRDNKPESAALIYKNNMEDAGLTKSYLNFLTNHHIGKAESAFNDGDITAADYKSILTGIKSLDLDDASEQASDKLKELERSDKGSSENTEKPAESQTETAGEA